MTKPFYTDYVRHCLRFYARNTRKPRFNTEVDKNNWYACHRAVEHWSDEEREIILQVYSLRDTLADNVYKVAEANCIDQNIIWDMLKELEHSVARKRGLI
jgi:hypothetical protein